jgi:hypothetical protein
MKTGLPVPLVPLMFIAHSLGGLVLKQVMPIRNRCCSLLTSKNVYKNKEEF